MPADPATNYAGHDDLYVARRAKGLPGWGSTEDARENTRRALAVLERHPTLRQGRLLEIGCGNGQMTLRLARAGYAMSGLDISPAAIAWACDDAEREDPTVRFHVGSVLSLPFADGTFDAVVDGNCLHCIVGSDRTVVLAEVRRVLTRGGVFAVQTMCGDPPAALRGRFDTNSRILRNPAGFAARFLGQEDRLLHELREAGFDVPWHVVEEVGPPDAPQSLLVAEAIARDVG